ncbi:polysaccharide deacetylase family protein [Shewanella eurypsychrophilus]|uniref:Polysaccharide deacetylase family protein n=1 Tax=Shewanella eurypsychrophilus TaxID=2593656 RepID=A0ABX6V824_9GAMM|nr:MULTISPECIES: polysaccharide deacetylase family protein [Shewanella]QFU23443.1 polysaccharide deacetylase family protein [Shewanella sp. YLB-09]QPG58671.1 polysaccharide deacetylase family protein [Shewanella eurypsychrophilus]
MRIIRWGLALFSCLLLLACSDESASAVQEARLVLTFDDAFVSNWHSVADEISTRGATATFFVSYYGNLDKYGNPRTPERQAKLHELSAKGFEIAQHSFSHAKANEYIAEHGSQQWLTEEVIRPSCYMLEDGFTVASFAYPHSNSNSAESDLALLNVFDSVRLYAPAETSMQDGIHEEIVPVLMSAHLDDQRSSLQEIKSAIDIIVRDKSTLILAGHDIANSSESNFYTTPERLFEVIDYAISQGVNFVHFKDLMNNRPVDYDSLYCGELLENE